MALRQLLPVFEPAAGLGVGDERPLRRMANPAVVGYRSGGNVSDILNTIKTASSVLIDGAVGVGKSTVLPGLIARELDVCVAHVVPSEFLAEELAAYLNAGDQKVVTLVRDVADHWPEKGVALMAASVLQAKMLSTGRLALPECVIYHDESHKSDAWTYLLSKQWGSIQGVRKYINATATSGAGGFRRPEPAGSLTVSKVPADAVDQPWRVLANRGYPWEVSAIMGNLLVFEDDNEKAADLIRDYTRAGMEVFRLHSRMKLALFQSAMSSLKGSGLTVLIADSSFRDGYTWNVSTIIDTGSVVYTSVVEGEPRLLRRDAFQFEVYQAAGRGARVAGQTCHVWQADRPYQPSRMILDEVEMEAVALVSRMLCTLPPIEVLDCVMAQGKVPRDLCAALNGGQPLALLRDTQLADLAPTGYARAPSPVIGARPEFQKPGSDFMHPGMSATLANKRDFVKLPSEASASVKSDDTKSTASISTAGFEDWYKSADEVIHAQPGKYYYSRDVNMAVTSSLAFPLAYKSVVAVYSPVWMRHTVLALSDAERSVMVAALLERFNQLGCEMNAMAMASQDVKLLATSRAREASRMWLNEYLENTTRLQAEMRLVADILETAVDGFTTLVEVDPGELLEKEKQMAAVIVESFRGLRVNCNDRAVVADRVDTSAYQVASPPVMANPMQLNDTRAFEKMRVKGGVSRPVQPPAYLTWLAGGKPGHSKKKSVV